MRSSILFRSLVLGSLTSLAGCTPQASAPTTTNSANMATRQQADTGAKGGAAAGGQMSAFAISENMKKLPPEDRILASNQMSCPICETLNAAKSVPIKVEVDGQPVFICCEECRELLLKDPDKYMAKLKKNEVGAKKDADVKDNDTTGDKKEKEDAPAEQPAATEKPAAP